MSKKSEVDYVEDCLKDIKGSKNFVFFGMILFFIGAIALGNAAYFLFTLFAADFLFLFGIYLVLVHKESKLMLETIKLKRETHNE